MSRLRALLPLLAALGAIPAPAAAQPAAGDGEAAMPRYLPALREELARLGLEPVCEVESPLRARCTFHHVTDDARRELTAHALYSDVSDTIYLWIPGVVLAPPESPATPGLLRRLMELNGTLLVPKLEWSPSDGEVRLSAVLRTDSNLDRRALRQVIRILFATASRYAPELERMVLEAEEL
ncbi:MAG TPA: hypothetical protein RMH85_08615 [Polyangiaceae bacterium LLY-WYZ-15_(1-7)]|nr:hypothetical protein [Sandaracinus sp.]HJL01436.1 hypothetical protein [Polyangiaceae bacterium LLY-WYZ-15_(1-7)]HJL08545.1 hypothetical protein [Polyangiaceae bacterium LLY-WYZ-15_(1-7)]HJL23950.1 hypothetical protein [Polyangiaceae bacterium LLY-WYZ-15_(1-7)]HJL28013.1 hypothetical protein [Polyangiaceae bacterium LLY-WYZ-15_(1-7)]